MFELHDNKSFETCHPDFEPYGLRCIYWQPPLPERPEHHNEVELNFLKSGSVTYLLGGKKFVVEVGKLCIFWAAIPHQIIEHSENPVYFVATIPLQHFLQWRLPDSFVQKLMQGQFIVEPDDQRADSDSKLFEGWVKDLKQSNEDYKKATLIEIQARLNRLALNLASSSTIVTAKEHLSNGTNNGLTKVEQMVCFISQHYTQKLTVEQIGEHVKLNPSYASNLFQKTLGSTLINYITKHRISHAKRLLTTTNLPVTEIALQSGFFTISRFNDAFNRSCGCSPRAYRKTHEIV